MSEPTPSRPWWRNCAIEADDDIRNIDQMEDKLAPLSPNATRIRQLIATLEMCHHKAERWVNNVIAAIGEGDTNKGLGTRAAGQTHPIEQVWQDACDALSAWCAGTTADSVKTTIGGRPAGEVLAALGERSPLKVWQVQRVIEKIRSHLHWPPDESSPEYRFVHLDVEAYQAGYQSQCPDYFRGQEEFWEATVGTVIHDTAGGARRRSSLGTAIDMLWPCHWNFLANLQIVLQAIGGQLHPAEPFAACGRNIELSPLRKRMAPVCQTLWMYSHDGDSDSKVDREIIETLGPPSAVKRWLAASLAKTISLQLDPPSGMQELCALAAPES